MSDLSLTQTILIGTIFAWSSFARSAFNFGGGLLSLPLLLAVHNEPIVFIPVIAVHLFIFSIWVLLVEVKPACLVNEVDWPFLKSALRWMVCPKLLGITGLVLLPAHWMGLVVLLLCAWFAIEFLKSPRVETHTTGAIVADKVWLMIAGQYQAFEFKRHYHLDYHFGLIVKGEQRFVCRGERFHVGYGEVVIMSPDVLHEGR